MNQEDINQEIEKSIADLRRSVSDFPKQLAEMRQLIADQDARAYNPRNIYSSTQFGSDVHISGRLVLSNGVYQEISYSGDMVHLPSANTPIFSNFSTWNKALEFRYTEDEWVYYTVVMPPSYMEGTDISAHIHIGHADNSTGNSIWQFKIQPMNVGDTIPSVRTGTGIDVAPGAAYTHTIVDCGTIVGSDLKVGTLLLVEVRRVVSGNSYNASVYGFNFDIVYKADTVGSSGVNSK